MRTAGMHVYARACVQVCSIIVDDSLKRVAWSTDKYIMRISKMTYKK